MDPFASFKAIQRQSWACFAPLEVWTTPPAATLVDHARIRAGQRVLDVGCGTGVVAVTAARRGAAVTGLDLTPELLARARENAAIANVTVDWHEGDVEALPFEDAGFDVVTSQFGHMFAPRPEIAIAEMLRVLAPGGTIAFSTWPPELFVGRMFALVGRYAPPPPPGVAPPPQWGDVNVIRERLGSRVRDLVFDRATMVVPCLTPAHNRAVVERTAGPVLKLVESLGTTDPAKLDAFRHEYDALAAEYYADNVLRQGFLMTRGIKS
ncbi:MAG: class I SAM-dependent methyltransferase [Acidobacteria bacterium]|nr:class I SAM-dependent methyltransferase [Acidobacteriota bacterium]